MNHTSESGEITPNELCELKNYLSCSSVNPQRRYLDFERVEKLINHEGIHKNSK